MKINKLQYLLPILTATLLTACPQHESADAAVSDATFDDAGLSDSATLSDAALDAGCAHPCDSEGETGLSVEGECQGTLLRYCENNCVVERDCAALAGGPYICGLYAPFYECLASAGQSCEPDYWDCDPASNCNGQQPCDESAGLLCEERGASFICVHAEAEDAGSGSSDAAITDVIATDSGNDAGMAEDASALDAAAGDHLIADSATSEDAADADAGVEDSAQVTWDAAATEDAQLSEDAAREDSGREDSGH